MAVKLKWSVSLIVAVMAVGFAGCGENKHTTGGDQPSAESSNSGAVQSVQEEPAGEKAIEEAPKVVEAPAPKVVEAPAPVVIAEKGEDGKDGKNGKDGRDSCVVFDNVVKGVLEALPPIELKKYRDSVYEGLPYLPIEPDHVKIVKEKRVIKRGAKSVGLVTIDGSNKGKGSKAYVNNSMVVFDMDVRLPPKKSIVLNQPIVPILKLQLFKKSVDEIGDTESICMIDNSRTPALRICSGRPFHTAEGMLATNNGRPLSGSQKELARWGTLIHPNFGEAPYINEYFSDNLNAATEGKKGTSWDGELALNLIDMLSPTNKRMTNEEFINMLYGDIPDDQYFVRKLRFVISDDTMVRSTKKEDDTVRMTELSFQFTYNGCDLDPSNQPKKKGSENPAAPVVETAPAVEAAPAVDAQAVDGGEAKGQVISAPVDDTNDMGNETQDDGAIEDSGASDEEVNF